MNQTCFAHKKETGKRIACSDKEEENKIKNNL